ncbi:MAG: hypothetical protein ACT4O9_15815 [Blastocatellia bacterium]
MEDYLLAFFTPPDAQISAWENSVSFLGKSRAVPAAFCSTIANWAAIRFVRASHPPEIRSE